MHTTIHPQIGNTPRDGYYGACFLPAANKIHLADTKVYCARPGSRLWEADVEGRVLQTSQYKLTAATPATASFNSAAQPAPCPLLPAIELDSELGQTAVTRTPPPPAPIAAADQHQPATLKKPPQLLHRLQPIFGRFIFSYNRNGFYIVDPQRTAIVLWNDQIRDIQSVRIVNGSTLLIFTSHRQVFSVTCRSLADGFVDLVAERQLADAARLLMAEQPYFRELCATHGYRAHVGRLRERLAAAAGATPPVSADCAAVLAELSGALDGEGADAAAGDGSADGEHRRRGVYTVDNVYVQQHGGGVQLRRPPATPGGGPLENENIRTALLSASRNIFNKFNIFNDLATGGGDADRRRAASGAVGGGIAGDTVRPSSPVCQRASSPVVRVIPYQNVDRAAVPAAAAAGSEVLVQSVRSTRRRPSSVPPAPPPHRPAAVVQLTAEERLLQSLYMIYQTARMSGLTLTERYAAIFDKYDCDGIRRLLDRLAGVMRLNGVPAETALAHCYEMYFNYLQPELVWEMDEPMREWLVAGFVLVNRQVDGNDLERCERCAYPLNLPAARAQQARYRELGATLFKYWWTRNQAARGFELAAAVPWTMELCCKFQLQHPAVLVVTATADDGDGDGNAAEAVAEAERTADRRLVRNLFACGSAGLLQMAVDQSGRFTLELWQQFAELLMLVHGESRMWCARCAEPLQLEPQVVNSEALLRNGFYAWPRLLDNLVQHMRGRNAIALVRRFAGRIDDAVIPKEFYLKCLLVP